MHIRPRDGVSNANESEIMILTWKRWPSGEKTVRASVIFYEIRIQV